MLSVISAVCHKYALYAEWHHAECFYAECHGATSFEAYMTTKTFITRMPSLTTCLPLICSVFVPFLYLPLYITNVDFINLFSHLLMIQTNKLEC
jgi:hypothetical protein